MTSLAMIELERVETRVLGALALVDAATGKITRQRKSPEHFRVRGSL